MTSASTTQTPLRERPAAPLSSSFSIDREFFSMGAKKKGRTVEGRKPCGLGGGGNEAQIGAAGELQTRQAAPLYSIIRPRYDVEQSLCQRAQARRRATKCTATNAPARSKTRFPSSLTRFRHARAVISALLDPRISRNGE
jgi:hypothetical protein